ncbi:hypothetical protein BOTBODRAFT_275827 [Botryobasidium botryosum FD-172 SS1]|uniref:Uncharacterized protein n=1 Tax=Botryobasidium botryosum (strain FD-172 SS1) TaxID=930990 RepID=A0A067MK53_BOTB1|nr:hypothetical protein BOTBODRAFT_275827 [Botryobasidium botryosum FD-172 SS1]
MGTSTSSLRRRESTIKGAALNPFRASISSFSKSIRRRRRTMEPQSYVFMDTIPVELLSYIFVLGAQESGDRFASVGYEDFTLLVSHVSRYWRDVALATSQLWDVVHVRNNDIHHHARVTLLLSRSKRSPIDIFVDLSGSKRKRQRALSPQSVTTFFETVIDPHISRLRRLRIHASSRELATLPFEAALVDGTAHAPRLQELDIDFRDDGRSSSGSESRVIHVKPLARHALQAIRLSGACLIYDGSADLGGLRHLTLGNTPRGYQLSDVLDTLRSLPNLESLELTHFDPLGGSGLDLQAPPIPLNSLKSLTLELYHSLHLNILLWLIDAPDLRVAALRATAYTLGDSSYATMLLHFLRQTPLLEELSLRNCGGYTLTAFTCVIACLISLRSLELQGIAFDPADPVMSGDKPPPALLPSIDTLRLITCVIVQPHADPIHRVMPLITLLRATVNLKTLYVGEWLGVDTIMDTLAASDLYTGAKYVCPRLLTLGLSHPPLPSLVSMLEHRAASGSTSRIDTITLPPEAARWSGKGFRTGRSLRARLEHVVPDLRYV